tara:strand:- start:2269 stop:2508 length:240 start_codon:yes stop_codon:yes gene_type:complete
MVKINIVLLNTIILLVLSVIIYNFRKKQLKLPRLNNNIRDEKYDIITSIGIAFVLLIPIILLQKEKKIIKLGINTAIKI